MLEDQHDITTALGGQAAIDLLQKIRISMI